MMLSGLSGILLALAFPKFNLSWLAWIALAPFFVSLSRSKDWKEAVKCGLAFGIIFFGIHLFWVNTLSQFVGPWAVLGWISLVLYQTLFILLFTLFTLVIWRANFGGFLGDTEICENWSLVIAVPAAWVAVEWLRAFGPWGVTGGVVGYTQASFLPLIQIASFASVYGVSFLVVLFNAAVADLLIRKRVWPLLFSAGLVILIFSFGLRIFGHWSLVIGHVAPVRVSLIQPSIDQKMKLDPAQVEKVYQIHEDLSRKAAFEHPQIIVWPETAIFTYLLRNEHYFNRIKMLARETNAYLLIGTPHYEGKNKIYNSIAAISPSGEVLSRYDKEQLVPFGEYLPLRFFLYPFLKNTGYFEAEFNSNPQAQTLSAGDLRASAAVCFESTFPELIRKRVRRGGDFILTVTNDAWFWDSSAPYYHFNAGVFRAIENRKYFIQVGNHGISGLIDPLGRVVKQSRVGERGVFTVNFRPL